jgi:hypothetical protein
MTDSLPPAWKRALANRAGEVREALDRRPASPRKPFVIGSIPELQPKITRVAPPQIVIRRCSQRRLFRGNLRYCPKPAVTDGKCAACYVKAVKAANGSS